MGWAVGGQSQSASRRGEGEGGRTGAGPVGFSHIVLWGRASGGWWCAHGNGSRPGIHCSVVGACMHTKLCVGAWGSVHRGHRASEGTEGFYTAGSWEPACAVQGGAAARRMGPGLLRHLACCGGQCVGGRVLGGR